MIILVMGVTGSGKTTLAKALAMELGWDFQEGDDLHPSTNIEKMRAGTPLSDADRYPWLDNVKSWIAERSARNASGVITCSALKRSYRVYLRAGGGPITLVAIRGRRSLIEDRLKARPAHFMPPSLLSSQLDILELPAEDENPIFVDAAMPTQQQVTTIKQSLRL